MFRDRPRGKAKPRSYAGRMKNSKGTFCGMAAIKTCLDVAFWLWFRTQIASVADNHGILVMTGSSVKKASFPGKVSRPSLNSSLARKRHVVGIASGRAARLRASWFAIGIGFGIALSSAGQWVSEMSLPEMPSLALASSASAVGKDAASRPDTARATKTEAVPEPIRWPRRVSVTVAAGDRLIDMLTDHGVAHADAFEIVRQMRRNFNPRTLRTGHKLEMVLEKDASREEATAAQLKRLVIHLSKIEDVSVTAAGGGIWRVERIKTPVIAETRQGGGIIKSSFYLTARQRGIPDKAIVELIRAYSYDVDFQRDIHVGDALDVMYTTLVTEDGDVVSSGDVLYAELKTRGKSLKLYRYTNSAGISGYYDEKGENVKKALLRTPVDGARISSGFGMRRHPILGYSKMHRGMDFAAPRGTPIYAAGDGIVEYAAPFSGYGNYVRVRHNGTYKTAYGHISRFAPGIRNGSKVRQGQVIAYVGATGMATGPHLHYEILRYNSQINPAGVKFAGGDRLTGRELAKFQETKRGYETKLAGLKTGPTKLASR